MLLPTSIKHAALAAYVCLAMACSQRPAPVSGPGLELQGEPEQYSATIVNSIDDGVERELNVTRIFKSGDLRREEWTEQGAERALIWRLDLGKSYLLDLEQRCYVETEITPNEDLKARNQSTGSGSPSSEAGSAPRGSAGVSRDAVEGEAVDRAFGDGPSAGRVETRRLADQTIDGHPCAVSEQRAIFSDDHVEVTTTFRARDLNGLAIKVETGSINNGVKLIARWRDIRSDLPADAFMVPAGFKKVDKLSR
jgi:hypothetical protein